MRSRAARSATALAAAGAAAAGVVAVATAGDRGGDSGVRGRVVPCGLIHERAAPCASGAAVARAKVVVRRAAGGAAVATARADAHGGFRIAVAAGTYRVEAQPRGGAGARPASVAATVPAHGWVTVMLPAGRMAPGARRGAA